MYIIKKIIQNHKSKVIAVIIIIVLVILNIYTLSLINFDSEEAIVIEEKQKQSAKIKVDIKGEINAPGVYEIENGKRVSELIEKAGGITKNADTSIINLSQKLTDEMVIFIYSKSEVSKFKENNQTPEITCPNINNACVTEENKNDVLIKNESTSNQSKQQKTPNAKISINSATEEELKTLTGIGTSKAKAIIEYRQKNGNFKTVEELLNIKGIGTSILEKIKDQITI